MSAREDLLVYLAAQLATVSNLTVYRTRQAAVAIEEGNCLILEPDEESVSKPGNGIAARDLTIRILLIVRAATPDSAADPLLQSIHNSFMSDPTLGGRAAACIEVGTRWNFEVADTTALVAEVRYRLKYLTPVGSFAAQA